MSFLTSLLTSVGGQALQAAFQKLADWWQAEGKVLFTGWYMKRQGKEEQQITDRNAQLEREGKEVSRANQRVQEIDQAAAQRARDGKPPLYGVRPPR